MNIYFRDDLWHFETWKKDRTKLDDLWELNLPAELTQHVQDSFVGRNDQQMNPGRVLCFDALAPRYCLVSDLSFTFCDSW